MPFTPAAIGAYRWIASYSGDVNNAPVAGACNDAGELSTISKASPTLVTTASAAVKLGAQVSDSAALDAGMRPGGALGVKLDGPGGAGCGCAP